MLQNQRLESIAEIVANNGFVEVEKLALDLKVSPMTIRRDLDKLHAAGVIERCHGGARLLHGIAQEEALENKKKVMSLEKTQIAAKALEYVEDGDTIFLDSGTTTAELANLLLMKKKPCMVFTNDLNIATLLCDSAADVYMIGGRVQKHTRSVFGPSSCRDLCQFRISKAFIGAAAVDHNYDVLTPTMEKAYLKSTVMDIAAHSYLLVDSSKFNSQATSYVCNLSVFDKVITDKYLTKPEQVKLTEMNIDIVKA